MAQTCQIENTWREKMVGGRAGLATENTEGPGARPCRGEMVERRLAVALVDCITAHRMKARNSDGDGEVMVALSKRQSEMY